MEAVQVAVTSTELPQYELLTAIIPSVWADCMHHRHMSPFLARFCTVCDLSGTPSARSVRVSQSVPSGKCLKHRNTPPL